MTTRRLLTQGLVLGFVVFAVGGSAWNSAAEPPDWNDLEADGPGAGFDAYFDPIFDFWVRDRGKRVAFRVMSESMHSRSKDATPAWVFEGGVPGVMHRGLRGQEQIDPVFWDERTVENGLSDPISYLNTNILSPQAWEDAPTDVKQLFAEAAKRIGYRFVMTKLNVSSKFHLDGTTSARLLTEHTWKNVGVAPCHESYALEFTLHDAHAQIVARQRHFPHRPTTLWWPGEEITERPGSTM